MDLGSLLIGVVIAGLGIAGFGIGAKALSRWRRLGANDPVRIREAITQSGLVEIEGTVRSGEATLESPHFREECVAYECKTEERRRRASRSGSRSTWRTIDSDEDARPFVVADESGTAYVDPEGASFSLASERTRKTNEQGEPVPDDSMLNFSLSINLPGMNTAGINNRRFTEKRLDVGSQCYVVGAAGRPPAEVDADVAIDGSEASTFLISDATEAETRRRLLLRGAGYTVGGIAGIAIGIGLLGPELLVAING
ncbi:GIDE domain-containing protein [Halorubrum vacuolatum]|uniref:RING-type E3 ubiquitin transferase n=1 Tax=Halorubrum vacuolatum TaxID=63740 RepID=A0A238X5W9_HALVU|nr:GIDE domain-containing protein [Halorubrum vacuolatum]SNR53981.1 E3 Ubiquitin ligase [Halorubrum vacuolatum]